MCGQGGLSVEIIFSLNDLNQEGYFIERGAYIYDGNIGLYFH